MRSPYLLIVEVPATNGLRLHAQVNGANLMRTACKTWDFYQSFILFYFLNLKVWNWNSVIHTQQDGFVLLFLCHSCKSKKLVNQWLQFIAVGKLVCWPWIQLQDTGTRQVQANFFFPNRRLCVKVFRYCISHFWTLEGAIYSVSIVVWA